MNNQDKEEIDYEFELPEGMTEEEFEKEFNNYMEQAIIDAKEEFIREKANGTYIPANDRIRMKVENGEITQDEADTIFEIVEKMKIEDLEE
jgi:hypothetical protein